MKRVPSQEPSTTCWTVKRGDRDVFGIGDQAILTRKCLGLICSVKCPGSVVIKTLDAIRELRDAGGHPILGYDIDTNGYKLVVNAEEAERVRAIFQLYLEHESLLPVVLELEQRGWVNKRWQTRKGRERGGKPFDRTTLYRLLTNVAYLGKVRYKDEVHNGEHAAVVDPGVFQNYRIDHKGGGVWDVSVRYGREESQAVIL